MLRRKPTKIELKLEDIEEYEIMKREIFAAQQKNSSGNTNSLMAAAKPHLSTDARIGYKPVDQLNSAARKL